ncbi:MAG TPA: (2Fe-2S)-binding protein [Myxococcaceae bacterium]|nr:(2Fe-2S)-binding protein [Myxococcaceae bacterium]
MADDKDRGKGNPSLRNPGRRRFLKGVGAVGAGAALVDKLALPGEGVAEAASPSAAPAGAKLKVALEINGQKRQATVESRTTLLSAMRDHLEPAVSGPKLVCDHGTCGACTVLLDGKPVYSCLVLALDAATKRITTVEGLGSADKLSPVQQAFVEKDALMCGFCTPGFVVSITSCLKANPNATVEQVRAACQGNFCRCGTYPKIFEAAMAAKGTQHAWMQTIENAVRGT